MARNGRFTTPTGRWAIACIFALAVSAVLGATHIHAAHPAHAAALPDADATGAPFVGRDCPACALAHAPAVARDVPTTIAPRDGAVGRTLEEILPTSSRVRTLRPARGPPPTR